MRIAAEYRLEAEKYVREADEALTGARCARLLEKARPWQRLAEQAELLESEARMNGSDAKPPQYSGL